MKKLCARVALISKSYLVCILSNNKQRFIKVVLQASTYLLLIVYFQFNLNEQSAIKA